MAARCSRCIRTRVVVTRPGRAQWTAALIDLHICISPVQAGGRVLMAARGNSRTASSSIAAMGAPAAARRQAWAARRLCPARSSLAAWPTPPPRRCWSRTAHNGKSSPHACPDHSLCDHICFNFSAVAHLWYPVFTLVQMPCSNGNCAVVHSAGARCRTSCSWTAAALAL